MPRPLTADDLYALTIIEDPQLSPDGSRLAYVRKTIDPATYDYRLAVWVVPTDGGEPQQFTAGPKDSAPRWSPDGRALAFLRAPAGEVEPKNEEELAQGVGKPQLWLLPADGGEARQLTHLRHGAGEALWSPDGETLLFSAQTGQPDDAIVDELALRGVKLPRVRTIDQLWYRFDGTGFIYELRAHLFAAPASGGTPRQLTDGDWDDGSPVWSPDGARVAFVSDRTDERWRWPGGDIWTLDLASGALNRHTDGSLSASTPAWAPDGRSIAFRAAPRRHGDGYSDLYVVASEPQPSSGDAARNLTRTYTPLCEDRCIDDLRSSHLHSELVWSADGRDIYFLGSMRGETQLYAIRADGGSEPRQLTNGQMHVYGVSPDAARTTLALAISDARTPGDLYRLPLTGQSAGAMERLTDVNGALFSEVELAEPEALDFTGADGWRIQGWTLRPPHANPHETLPAILQIHGGPAYMYGWSFFFEFQLLAAQGYAVVYSNPRGSVGYGHTFAGAVIGVWGDNDYQDVMAGLDAAIARGGIDPERLGVAGGSYGGFMTNWIVGHSDRFKAGVTMRCVANLATMFGVSDLGWDITDEFGAAPWDGLDTLMRHSPITYVAHISTPLLILHSDNDLRCPISEGEQVFAALKYLGRETKMVRFEGQSHDLSRTGHPRARVRRLEEITGWFQRYLPINAGQPEPPSDATVASNGYGGVDQFDQDANALATLEQDIAD